MLAHRKQPQPKIFHPPTERVAQNVSSVCRFCASIATVANRTTCTDQNTPVARHIAFWQVSYFRQDTVKHLFFTTLTIEYEITPLLKAIRLSRSGPTPWVDLVHAVSLPVHTTSAHSPVIINIKLHSLQAALHAMSLYSFRTRELFDRINSSFWH